MPGRAGECRFVKIDWQLVAGFAILTLVLAGDRAAKASVAGAAAAAVLMASNTWRLALAAGVGSRSLISYGHDKRAGYQTLVRVAEILETRARSPGLTLR